MEDNVLLTHQKKIMEYGFWAETDKATLIWALEKTFTKDVLIEYLISDVVMNGDKPLVRWTKRHRSLTEEEYSEKY